MMPYRTCINFSTGALSSLYLVFRLSEILSSCCMVIFGALGFKEHEVGGSILLFSDNGYGVHHGLLKVAV